MGRPTGWADLLDIRLVTLSDVGLTPTSSDREVWHRAQELGAVLLTENRNGASADSLEQTIVDSLTSTSLPVLTLSDGKRFFMDRQYRSVAIERIVEILTYLDESRGISRLYVP